MTMNPFRNNPALKKEFGRRAAWRRFILRFGTDPEQDWRIIFIVYLVLNLASVAFHLFLYTRINQGEIFLADKKSVAARESLNVSELREKVTLLEKRQEHFEAVRQNPPEVPDPSR